MEVGAEEEEVVVVLGEVAEWRPAPDANPWLSLPQRQGQAVFHERCETP